jgi:hypothetical protein
MDLDPDPVSKDHGYGTMPESPIKRLAVVK